MTTLGGYWPVICCRATRFGTIQTGALLQRSSSTRQCRPVASHQVREAAYARGAIPTTVLFSPATQAGFCRTVQGPEKRVKTHVECWLKSCSRKTCFTSVNGAKQRLAAGAHRAVVNGPSDCCIRPTLGTQPRVSKRLRRHGRAGQFMKSPCGLPRFTISLQ